jgi:phospholipid/cholesterol/gamma-HCH transport system substrate-binding protein
LPLNTEFTYLSNMKDRTLGYIVLAILFFFLLTPVAFLIYKSCAPVETRVIEFNALNSMSFLTKQDPVRIKGFEIGIVTNVYSYKMRTRVEIETSEPLKIYRGYNIVVTAKGFMGDRFISINPGDSSAGLIDKNEILKGKFLPGPAEAIAYVSKLQEAIDTLDKLTIKFKDGFGNSPSFISKFKEVSSQFDSLSSAVVFFSKELQSQSVKIDSLVKFLDQMQSLSDTLSTSLPDMITTVEDLLKKTDILVMKVDSLMNSSSAFVSKISGPESIVFKDYISDLRKNLTDLRKVIREFESEGIRLPIRL